MRKNDPIEHLFREKFEGYRVPPSEGLWGRLVRQLRWREFLHFSPGSFNIWYLTGILAVAVAGYLGFAEHETPPSSAGSAVVRQTVSSQTVPADAGIREKGEPSSAAAVVTEEKRREHSPQRRQQPAKHTPPPVTQPGKNDVRAEHPVASHEKALPVQSPVKARGDESVEVTALRVSPPPLARFDLDIHAGCPPLSVRFVNRSEHAVLFSWNIEPAGISFHNRDTILTFREPGTYVVRLTAGDEEGRLSVAEDTVVVYERPRAAFDFSPREAQVPDDEITFFNSSYLADRYLWSFGDGHTSSEADPVHRYTVDGPVDVILKVWSAEGCVDSMVVKNAFAGNKYYIRFPNAFVPNPNGPSGGYYSEGTLSNDVFHPVWKGVAEYDLQIFNRRGELVFESKELAKGWDGYVLDQLATPGVYIWKSRGAFINGKPFVRFGNVTVIRKK